MKTEEHEKTRTGEEGGTRGALAEMRTLLLELRPIGLGEVGLEDLLKQLAAGVSGRIRAEIQVNAEGKAVLPTDVKLAFYRIAQEALNNTAKHSGADQVDIEIKSVPSPSSRKCRRGGSSQAIGDARREAKRPGLLRTRRQTARTGGACPR